MDNHRYSMMRRFLVAVLLVLFAATCVSAATTFKWATPEALVSEMTTSLNWLADGSFAGVTSNHTNSTDLFQYISCELVLSSLSPSTGAFVDVWIQYALDGSNYTDSSKPLQTSSLLMTFPLDTAASTAQRNAIINVPIAPYEFKLNLRNKSGVFFGTGNTLKCARHNEQGT